MKNQSGIYEILSTVNGKRYIGQAVNFGARWKKHRNDLARRVHHSVLLQRAWDKYGPGAFKFLLVITCAPRMLTFYEQQLLDRVQPEYNIDRVAGSRRGAKLTPAQCAARSEQVRGRKHSAETKAKIAAALTGKKRPPEACANMGRGQRGLVKNYPRTRKSAGPRPLGVREKISAAQRGIPKKASK